MRCKLAIKNDFIICKQNWDTPVIVYLCVNAASNIFLVKPKRYESQSVSRSTAASQISVSAAAIWRKNSHFYVWLKERKSNDLQVLSKIIDVLFNKRKWQCVQWATYCLSFRLKFEYLRQAVWFYKKCHRFWKMKTFSNSRPIRKVENCSLKSLLFGWGT